MIDQQTVGKILDAANILDVVSDFVTLRKRGVNYIGLCPFHNEKTPSFSVSPSKGICKCFSCGKGGSSVYFIMEHEQLSYFEALKYLAKKYHIEIVERELSEEERQAQTARESMFIVNAFAQEHFAYLLNEHLDGKSIGMAYFRERGFYDTTIKKFGLGYALDQRDAFAQAAIKKGYNKEFLFKTGLCIEGQNGYIADRFRGRVIFPVYTLSGKVVAFGGRILKKDEKMAKYVNSPESEVYHKSSELYGLFQAKQAIVKHDNCFLVEGYTDVLSMHQAGIENVVASSGTALTPGQIRLIHRFTEHITVIYDGDAAGIKASMRGIDLLLREGMDVKVVLLPDGDDPDSFSKKQSAESFTQYIEQHKVDFLRFKTNLLMESAGNDPVKRASLISDIVESIALVPNNIVQSEYIKECSRLMQVNEKLLVAEVVKAEQRQQEGAGAVTLRQPIENNPLPETTSEEISNQTVIPHVASPFDRFELQLAYYVVRYADVVFAQGVSQDTNEPFEYRVAPYIHNDLQEDDIVLQHPLCKQILKEAVEQIEQTGSCSSHYFVAHPSLELSHLATNMVSERYQLSTIHSRFQKIESEQEQLIRFVPRALFEFKDAVVSQEITRLLNEIRLRQKSNSNEVKELMQRINELYQLRSSLAKEIGDRILHRR